MDAGSRFRKNESESESDQSPTDDIVGLLTRAKPGYTVRWEEDGAEKEYVDVCPLPLHGDPNAFIAPRDFDRLARDGSYMAVIHADGNMVGDRQRALNSESKSKADTPVPVHAEAAFKLWFEAETKVECFFHCMRKAVRQALCEALWRTFNPKKQDHGYFPGPLESGKPRARPYQLMMLGGDDLLLVCRARNALDFVRHYARALARRPLDGGMPLGIGAGVVISQPSLPFHRLHHLADALAGSAKRLVRGLREYWAADKGLEVARFSAVDWMVCTNAWADDPAQARAVDRLRFEIVGSPPLDLALSCKPYWVLDEGAEVFGKAAAAGAKLWSLDRLRGGADKLQRKLKRGDAARSQLKSLPGAMRAGFHAGLLAFEDLPGETREGLNAAGIGETPWLNASGKPMAMQDQGDSLALTRVLDLVEVFEIVRLGRRAERPRTQSERRTGSDAVRENAQ